MSAFYHFDASRLDAFTLEGYHAWIPALQARKTLRELAYRPDVELSPEHVHELTLRAYGDEGLADQAAHDHMQMLQRREHERGDGATG